MDLKMFFENLREVGGNQTIDHVRNVGTLMDKFSEVIPEGNSNWWYAGLFHDAGKLFVPYELLNSKERLSSEQYEIIKTHTTIAGYGVAHNLKIHDELRQDVEDCAKYHHAWFNGKHCSETEQGGYYYGMKDKEEYSFAGEAIPLVARACAICDVYEALTAERSYKKGYSKEQALKIMKGGMQRGQFDPKLFRVFFNQVVGLSNEQIKEA